MSDDERTAVLMIADILTDLIADNWHQLVGGATSAQAYAVALAQAKEKLTRPETP